MRPTPRRRPDELPPLSRRARIGYILVLLAALAAFLWASSMDYHDSLAGIL